MSKFPSSALLLKGRHPYHTFVTSAGATVDLYFTGTRKMRSVPSTQFDGAFEADKKRHYMNKGRQLLKKQE